jgi:hypothetical protein
MAAVHRPLRYKTHGRRMNASMESVAFAFSMAVTVIPFLLAAFCLQLALLRGHNRKRVQPLSGTAVAARAALGLGAGCVIGLAFIALVVLLVAQTNAGLNDPGFIFMLISLPLGAVLALIASHLLSRRWLATGRT